MGRIAWKEFINLPNHLKQLENYNLLLTMILKVTLSMHLINTPMVYRKDNLCGMYVLTICFFNKKSFFKERAG